MRSLVIYDSFFGNTQKISLEIGRGLGELTDVVNVRDFKKSLLEDIEQIVIGSPTRAFRPTSKIVSLLKRISKSNKNLNVAIFDTRMHIKDTDPWILRKLEKKFGYAVDTMQKIVEKSSNLKMSSVSWFYVEGTEGPTSEDELARAKEWSKELVWFRINLI